jgi:hypothetical protein
MKERPKTLAQVADGLMALRSAVHSSNYFVWDELSRFAEDIRRLKEAERLRKALETILDEIKNSNIRPETILAARSLVGQDHD